MTPSTLVPRAAVGAASEAGGALRQLLLFALGGELFAIALDACEEVLEEPAVERVSGMPVAALGVFDLRGQLLVLYSPEHVLRVKRSDEAGVALVVRVQGKRIALSLDDVDEVIAVDMDDLKQPSPRDATDGILLGITRHRDELVAVVDAGVLAASCMTTVAGESR
jgi:chemotaxis signal transduction protein